MEDHQPTSFLNTLFWTTLYFYISYKLVTNIRYAIWILNSIWFNLLRLTHFCIEVFDYAP